MTHYWALTLFCDRECTMLANPTVLPRELVLASDAAALSAALEAWEKALRESLLLEVDCHVLDAKDAERILDTVRKNVERITHDPLRNRQ